MIGPDETVTAPHVCTMPNTYHAPRGFSKLLYEAVLFGSSRASEINFLSRFVQRTVVACGRCGSRIDNALWSRKEIAAFCNFAAQSDLDALRALIQGDYDAKRPRCPACAHVAPLACGASASESPCRECPF